MSGDPGEAAADWRLLVYPVEKTVKVCALGVNRHTEKAPEMTTFGAEKCATVAVTPQFIPSRSDLSVGTVVSTETVNKDCVHRTKS